MHSEKGLSLIESLVVIAILAIIASSYSETEKYLRGLKAHRLCANIEYYLNNLKFITDHKNTVSSLLVKNDNQIIGLNSGKILFSEFSSPNKIGIKAGVGSPDSLLFYSNNSSSPGSIFVSTQNKDKLDTLCAVNVSLRGRIRKLNYGN